MEAMSWYRFLSFGKEEKQSSDRCNAIATDSHFRVTRPPTPLVLFDRLESRNQQKYFCVLILHVGK